MLSIRFSQSRRAARLLFAAFLTVTAVQAQVFDSQEVLFAEGLVAPRCYDIADIDGDGVDDVVGTFFGSFTVAWFKSDGASTPTLTTHPITQSLFGPVWVSAGDLNGDGHVDVAAAAFDGRRFAWYENGGGGSSWTEHVLLTDQLGPKFIFCHDMDGDGDLDLVAAVRNSNEVLWLENVLDDSGSFIRRDVSATLAAPQSAWPADLNGDGRPDLVVPGFGDNTIAWFDAPTTPGGVWARHDVDLSAGGVRDLRVADLNQDGHLDIVAALISDKEVVWYENDGSALNWTRHAIISSYDGAAAVYVADVDGDGDLDVASTAAFADDVTWHENVSGDASAWTHWPLTDGQDFPLFVLLADLDGDGDPEALVASNDDNVSAFYPNISPVVGFESIVARDPNPAGNSDPSQFTNEQLIAVDLNTAGGNFLDAIHVSFDEFATSTSIPYTGQGQISATLPDVDGLYPVGVRLSNLGWTGPATTDTIVLDRVAPTTQITGPFSPVTQTSPVITFTYLANDGTTFVDKVQLHYRRTDQGSPGPFTPYGVPQPLAATIDFDSSSVSDGGDGVYEFQTIGYDPAGNAEDLNANGDITIEFRWVRGGWVVY